MKCLRFLLILVRGPPINKGVFTGIQPRKDALFLLGWQFDFLWNNRQLNDGERT
jgi:hypothetical protein